MKVVRSLRLVCSLRWLVTTMRFSGQANAHRLQEMHSVSPLSGLMLSRGAPRRAAIPLADFGPLGRILLGIYTLGVLVAESHPETLEEVYEKDGAEELSNHFPPLMPWWGRTPVLRPASTPVQAGPGGPAQTWRSAHSSIHLAEHDIQRTNNRHYVGHQAAPHHPVERLQIHERWRPHAHAIGRR